MTDSNRIVMRSDRLPSGDLFKTYLNNTYLLQQNNNINIYSFVEAGVISTGPTLFNPSYGGGDGLSDGNAYNSVLNSFTCNGIAELKCYENYGLSLTVNQPCKNNDSVENGCYVFVKDPLFGLPNDFKSMGEYIYRFRFNYGLCQGVLSNVFNNNWINGNLYAYPFKVDTIFGSNNKVSQRKYPKNLVVLHDETNSFYYRSSPYDDGSNLFIGSPGNQSGDGGNVRYDVTIVTAGSAANNTLTIVDGYKKTDVYTEKAYLWTYGNGSSANSPYLIYNANTDNLQNILNL
jgi:hypothetical protein